MHSSILRPMNLFNDTTIHGSNVKHTVPASSSSSSSSTAPSNVTAVPPVPVNSEMKHLVALQWPSSTQNLVQQMKDMGVNAFADALELKTEDRKDSDKLQVVVEKELGSLSSIDEVIALSKLMYTHQHKNNTIATNSEKYDMKMVKSVVGSAIHIAVIKSKKKSKTTGGGGGLKRKATATTTTTTDKEDEDNHDTTNDKSQPVDTSSNTNTASITDTSTTTTTSSSSSSTGVNGIELNGTASNKKIKIHTHSTDIGNNDSMKSGVEVVSVDVLKTMVAANNNNFEVLGTQQQAILASQIALTKSFGEKLEKLEAKMQNMLDGFENACKKIDLVPNISDKMDVMDKITDNLCDIKSRVNEMHQLMETKDGEDNGYDQEE